MKETSVEKSGSRDHDAVWGTVGVSENIIEASRLALCDSFEYKLFRDLEARPTPSNNGGEHVGTSA